MANSVKSADDSKTVILSVKDYNELLRDQSKLWALENGGVDNWEWYSESLTDWRKEWYPEDSED